MSDRKYFKRNYVDVLKVITPKVYLQDDINLAGLASDINQDLINSHIISSKYITYLTKENEVSGLHVSATSNLEDIDNIKGISKYFIKQNNLTNITPKFFDDVILRPLNTRLTNYKSKDDFADYVSGTLLPSIHPNTDITANTASAFGNNNTESHEFLTSSLNWLYFLNTSGLITRSKTGEELVGFSPSSLVFSALTDMIFEGKDITLDYAIKMYQEYVWKNYNALSSLDVNVIPPNFMSGTGTYTSGTQNLDKLKTLIDIEYSPLYTDKNNTKVKDSFENYLLFNSVESEKVEDGPLHKLLRAVAYSMYDVNDQVESIKLLTSIESCPKDYLPFLADLVGWRLYGSDEAAWRRQLRSAVDLYKKKGTKQGLIDALHAVIPNSPLDPENSITEFYESYVPNLIFYLLKTDSPLFESLSTWTQDKAMTFGIPGYDPSDLDLNIKYVVDEILKRCVTEFPTQFRIGNEPFRVHTLDSGKAWFDDYDSPPDGLGDVHQTPLGAPHYGRWMTYKAPNPNSEYVATLGDPNFVFNYRGRLYPIPPWEDERYYADTAITEDLLDFIINELNCLEVALSSTEKLKSFIQDNTTAKLSTSKSRQSGFLFLTSSLELPPNYETIISKHQRDKYDYISMWNGKSSMFNFEVVGGDFDVLYLTDSRYTKRDVFDSLKIIDDFAPAKSKPQADFVLRHVDYLSSIGNTAISYRLNLNDLHTSGALGGYEASSVNLRGEGMRGQDFHSGFDDSKGNHIHDTLPVFKREQVDSFTDTAMGSTSAIAIPRNSIRRRNFKNVITQKGGGWYSRRGDSMPVYFNTSSSYPEKSFDYTLLGFVPSSLNFHPVDDVTNTSSVYNVSNDPNSVNTYFNVDVSNTFPVRGDTSIWDVSSQDDYIRRDAAPDIIRVLHALTERIESEKAKIESDHNAQYFNASSAWCNIVESLKNQKAYLGMNFDEFFNKRLDQRQSVRYLSEDKSGNNRKNIGKGIHSLYRDYIEHFYSDGLSGKLIDSRLDGGKNLLSHVYGPLFYNGNLRVDGSGIATSGIFQASSYGSQYELNLARDYTSSALSGIGVSLHSADKDLYVRVPEYRTQHMVSGVELVDGSAIEGVVPKNWFSIVELDPTLSRPNSDGYFAGNKFILSKSRSHGVPRLRLNLSATESNNNFLIPEHYLSLAVNCIPFKDDTPEIGGASVGVWIHTDVENDVDNKKVFWNYMPDGSWSMQDASSVTDIEIGETTVLEKLAHKFTLDSSSLEGETQTTTYCTEGVEYDTIVDLPTLEILQEKHVQCLKLNFDTHNSKINVPINYFSKLVGTKQGHQVHRKAQNYIVEVFLYPTNEDTTTILFDSVSIVDETQRDRAFIAEEFILPDFSQTDEIFHESPGALVDLSAGFWKQDGSKVAVETSTTTAEFSDMPSLLNYSFPDFGYNTYINNYWSDDEEKGVEFQRQLKPFNGDPLPGCGYCGDGPDWGHFLHHPNGDYDSALWDDDVFARGMWFDGWSSPLHYASDDGLTTYSTGIERVAMAEDDIADRPVSFGDSANLNYIFPIQTFRHTDPRHFSPEGVQNPWIPGTVYAGEQMFSGEEYLHLNEMLQYGIIAFSTNELYSLGWLIYQGENRESIRETIFDPTGTYFNAATRAAFDNNPTDFTNINRAIQTNYGAGSIPPNGIVQDIPYTELEDGKEYTFSVYFKPGLGTSGLAVDNWGDVIDTDYGSFLLTLNYLRPKHDESWFIYNTSGNAATQPTNPNTGVVNEGNTAHWDAASSLPYTTIKVTPGNAVQGQAMVSSYAVNGPAFYDATSPAVEGERCNVVELENGWFRASVSVHWRSSWINRTIDAPNNPGLWDNKEEFAFHKNKVNGLRITMQMQKPHSYDYATPQNVNWYQTNSIKVVNDWKVWGSLFHEGNASELKDFQYMGGDLFVGDTDTITKIDKELCYMDTSGSMFTGTTKVKDASSIGEWSGIQRVTASVQNPLTGIIKLNTQVSAHNYANTNFSGGYFYLDENAVPRDIDGSAFVGITSSTLGSYIEKKETAYAQIEEDELLVILRYFNSLTNNLGSRNAAVTASNMETSGGGRLNYRLHPYQMDGQNSPGLWTVRDSNYEQVTKLDITN